MLFAAMLLTLLIALSRSAPHRMAEKWPSAPAAASSACCRPRLRHQLHVGPSHAYDLVFSLCSCWPA